MTRQIRYKDRFGYPLSTTSDTAAKRFQEGVDLYMSGNAGGEEKLKEATEADPEFALASSALAVVLWDGRRFEEARSSADLAQKLATDLPRREKQHAEAIAVFAGGGGPRAFGLMQKHLVEFPRDAMILLRAERYLFFSGGQDRQRLQFELLDSFSKNYEDDWWFPGHYGFTLGELGNHQMATRFAERSLELNSQNIWAAHTIAHVHADTKDDKKGTAFLGPWLSNCDPRAPMYGHVSWHLALFELGCGRFQRSMKTYDECVRPGVCKHRSTLSNAASFLWRCKVYGYRPSAKQWDELQDLADDIAEQDQGEWDSMNAALAYAGAGNQRGKNNLLAGLQKLSDNGKASAGEIGIPLVEGAWAFVREDYNEAIRFLERAIYHIEGIGGSGAQHEAFWDALIESYLRVGRFTEARGIQQGRLGPRPSVRDLFRLGRAQIGCGMVEEAAMSLSLVSMGWRGADSSSYETVMLGELLESIEATQ